MAARTAAPTVPRTAGRPPAGTTVAPTVARTAVPMAARTAAPMVVPTVAPTAARTVRPDRGSRRPGPGRAAAPSGSAPLHRDRPRRVRRAVLVAPAAAHPG